MTTVSSSQGLLRAASATPLVSAPPRWLHSGPFRGLTSLCVACAALCLAACLLAVPAFASDADWQKSYTITNFPLQDNPPPCAANSSVTATKEVTVTATLTWIGGGAPPSKIVVVENAVVSWGATLSRSQISVPKGDPPLEPNGNMIGSGHTGLSDVITKVPDPWTNSEKGESVAGTREQKISVPSNGVCELPAVTLKATATTTTGADTTGNATVTLGGYTVTVPDGTAHASASFDLTPSGTWEITHFVYTATEDETFTLTPSGPDAHPGLSVTVQGLGTTVDKTVTVIEYFESSISEIGFGTSHIYLSGSLTVEGNISSKFFAAQSSVDSYLSGSAPDAERLSYNKPKSVPLSPAPGDTRIWFIPDTSKTGTLSLILKAKASTDISQ